MSVHNHLQYPSGAAGWELAVRSLAGVQSPMLHTDKCDQDHVGHAFFGVGFAAEWGVLVPYSSWSWDLNAFSPRSLLAVWVAHVI